MEIDYEKLRDALFKHFENELPTIPEALFNLLRVEGASDEELLVIARREKIDLNDYIMEKQEKKKK